MENKSIDICGGINIKLRIGDFVTFNDIGGIFEYQGKAIFKKIIERKDSDKEKEIIIL